MKKSGWLLCALLGTVGQFTTAFSQVTISENFNSYPANSVIGSPWINTNADNDSSRKTRVLEDTENLFGEGTSNKYLYLYAYQTGTSNIGLYQSFNDNYGYGNLGQIDLEFYDPDVSTAAGSNYGLLIRLSTSGGLPSNGNSPFFITLYDGGIYDGDTKQLIANYDVNTPVEMSIVFNNSEFDADYANDITLESGSYDVWINGTMVGSGTRRDIADDLGKTLKSIIFNSPGSNATLTEMYINKMVLADTISIPEPALSACVLSLVALAGLAARRRTIHR